MATLKEVNAALKVEFADLELVRGNGYYYFAGKDCDRWRETGLYGGWLLKDTATKRYIEEARRRSKKAGTP
jgi:hypothetical protein